jgi:glucuronate isomerase
MTAMEIYDDIQEKLRTPKFLPRSLFDEFNIEVLTTTDGAADPLAYHKKIQESGWNGKVIPCFRPDAVVNILEPAWQVEIDTLSEAAGIEIDSFKTYIQALESQREFFKSMGAVSTDQGVLSPFTHELSANEIDLIF